MKIKIKKQMNLPQLIEWAWENDITNQEFICNGFKSKSVIFNFAAYAEFSNEFYYNSDDTFTVEIEEELTEDTELDLIERFTVNNETYYTNPRKMSINTSLESAPEYINITHFYVENDDLELVLIWRDGKLVE